MIVKGRKESIKKIATILRKETRICYNSHSFSSFGLEDLKMH
jgi:hypothetical protein